MTDIRVFAKTEKTSLSFVVDTYPNAEDMQRWQTLAEFVPHAEWHAEEDAPRR